MQVHDWLENLRRRLAPESDTASLDAQVLLAHVLERPRAWVLAHPEAALTPEQSAALEAAAQRLEQGEPLPYVLGQWEFYGLGFKVTPQVLIPRPETELLVMEALDWLEKHPHARRGVDVGTGSGCIAVTLVRKAPQLRLAATDLSLPALRVAQENARRLETAERIDFVQADLLAGLEASFDLICANLPYIPRQTLLALKVYRWEPALALAGGEDGLDLIRRLLQMAPGRLAPGGLVLLEIEASLGEAVRRLAQAAFPLAEVQVRQDFAGLDRLVRIST